MHVPAETANRVSPCWREATKTTCVYGVVTNDNAVHTIMIGPDEGVWRGWGA